MEEEDGAADGAVSRRANPFAFSHFSRSAHWRQKRTSYPEHALGRATNVQQALIAHCEELTARSLWRP